MADATGDKIADDKSESTNRDSKPKPLVKLANTVATCSGATAKKVGRGSQSNGLDKDAGDKSRTKSLDETNSSVENNGDSDEDDDGETDFSDFTPSESDNDRDSDLDFSVHDSHSRRSKKMSKKRKQKAAKKALQQSKKRRQSIQEPVSDDASTPNRKKTPKAVSKKNAGGSAKTLSTTTPSTSTTLKTPVASSTPRLSKTANVKDTPQANATSKEGTHVSGQKGSAQLSAVKGSNTKGSAQTTKPTATIPATDPPPNPKVSLPTNKPSTQMVAPTVVIKGASPTTKSTSASQTVSQGPHAKGSVQVSRATGNSQTTATQSTLVKGSSQPTRLMETGPMQSPTQQSNQRASLQTPKLIGMLQTASNPKVSPQTTQPKTMFQAEPQMASQRSSNQATRTVGSLQPGEPKVITQSIRDVDEPRKVFTTSVRTVPITVASDASRSRSMILIRHNPNERRKVIPDAENTTMVTPTTLYTVDNSKRSIIDAVPSGQKLVRVTMIEQPTNAQTVAMRLPDPNVLSSRITYTNKSLQRSLNPSPRPAQISQPMKLQSEQDKQLDLINLLVQAELSKPASTIPMASVSSISDAPMPAAIPNIVKMLETPEMEGIDNDVLGLSNPFDSSICTSDDDQLLPVDLLDSIDNPEELSDDLMRDVARLVEEDKTLRDVIDQEVLSQTLPTQMMPITSTVVMPTAIVQQPKPIILNTFRPVGTGLSSSSPMQIVARIVTGTNAATTTTTPTTTITNVLREPIRVKRSDGRIIVLPPIEAPTTRGAKRRAEFVPTPEMPSKSKVIVTSTDAPVMKSPSSVVESPQKKEPPKVKPVAVQDRRSSVAAKNSPQRSKVKRSLSISNPLQFDDLDDEADGSDYSCNSEDDPHR